MPVPGFDEERLMVVIESQVAMTIGVVNRALDDREIDVTITVAV